MRKSILDGVGEIIDRVLGFTGKTSFGKAPHYRHRKSYQWLVATRTSTIKGEALIGAIYVKVASNLTGRTPSGENWRLTVNPAKDDKAKSRSRDKKIEVWLERRIIQLPGCWFNQVPTASGLVTEHSDKRGSIDLVHRCGDRSYEFIELKVASNNPLFAAMEILQYGILYILARRNKSIQRACKEKELINAAAIYLRVLAPMEYYENECSEKVDLGWLESEINEGLKRFLKQESRNLNMDFKFEAFPEYFSLSPFPSVEAIGKALESRRPVYS